MFFFDGFKAIFWIWLSDFSLIDFDPRRILSCGLLYNILSGSSSASNLYVASIAADRALMVLQPTNYRRRITNFNIRLKVFLILVFVIIVQTPMNPVFSYNPQSTIFFCEFRRVEYRFYFRLLSFVQAFACVLIPSIIIFVSSMVLLVNRQKNIFRRTNRSSPSERMRKVAVFIALGSITTGLMMIITSILCAILVHRQLYSDTLNSSEKRRTSRILLNFYFTSITVVHSIKFYFHILISERSRHIFLRIISFKRVNRNTREISRQNQMNKNPFLLVSSDENQNLKI